MKYFVYTDMWKKKYEIHAKFIYEIRLYKYNWHGRKKKERKKKNGQKPRKKERNKFTTYQMNGMYDNLLYYNIVLYTVCINTSEWAQQFLFSFHLKK